MDVEIRSVTKDDFNDIQELNYKLCIYELEESDKTIDKEYPIQDGGGL